MYCHIIILLDNSPCKILISVYPLKGAFSFGKLLISSIGSFNSQKNIGYQIYIYKYITKAHFLSTTIYL